MAYLSKTPGAFSAEGGVSNFYKGGDVASAATITPTGNLFHVTGSVTISAVATTGITAGTSITMIFDATCTVENGASLVLTGAIDYTAAAGDMLTLSYDGTAWKETNRSSTLSTASHEALDQLIHFISDGPTTGTSLRRATTGTTFPTAVVWYRTTIYGEVKFVEKLITWTGAVPTTIVWKIYDDSEALLSTITDTITYSDVFETGRTRVVS